jgi:microsomal dipeptidase-like Zn-dependent dipeptidase
MNNITRRRFIQSGLLTGAGILSGGILGGLARSNGLLEVGTEQPDASKSRLLVDLHAHVMIDEWNQHSPLAVRAPEFAAIIKQSFNKTSVTLEDAYDAGVNVLCATHFNMFDEWLSMPTDPNPEAPAHTFRMLNLLENKLKEDKYRNIAVLAKTSADLKELTKALPGEPGYKVVLVHTLEGGHALGGSLVPIKELADRGVAMICITHFFNKGIGSSANSFPFFPDGTDLPANLGLSAFGKDVVAEMIHNGIIVDITHGTSTMVADVLRDFSVPIAASHSSSRTLSDHPYSLYDEHIIEIANRGGVIGVLMMPYDLSNYGTSNYADEHSNLNDVVRTIVYIAKIAGVEHVSIGTDFAGYIPGPGGISGIKDISKLKELLKKEFDDADVEKIMATNALNFLIKNWGKN